MRLPSGLSLAEQFARHLRAEHGEGARAVRIVRGQKFAAGHAHLQRARKIGAHAVERDAAALALVHDFGVALHHRIGQLHIGRAAQGQRIVDGERPHRIHRAERGPVSLDAPRADADDVGAELGELGDDEAVQAFADGGEQDHRGDADGDAERGEHRAQPLRPERSVGEADEIGVAHRASTCATAPAPDRASRRAVPAPP